MKRNLLFGITTYLLYLVFSWKYLFPAEALLLFSILVVVPFSFMLIDKKKRDHSLLPLTGWVCRFYPFAALGALFSLVTNEYLFSLLWLGFTFLTALFGLLRFAERGARPLSELSIDSGLMYLSLGGLWFLTYTAHIKVMDFPIITNLLTAMHFHYSAFIIPILAGFLGRKQLRYKKLYSAVTIALILSPLTIAAGISFSRAIEFTSVLIYLAAIYAYCFLVFTASFRKKLARIFISISSAVLMITICFSLLYSWGRLQNAASISIQSMIFIHGAVNAFGVVLPALIGWLIEGTEDGLSSFYGKPMSRLVGNRAIGGSFLKKKKLIDSNIYDGLINRMKNFASDKFDESKLSPLIADFYENTKKYSLKANIRWSVWFKPLAYLYEKISRHIQQIHLSMGGVWEPMEGDIIGVNSQEDGRNHVRAWIRKNGRGEAIFVALYSEHHHRGITYMNVALPLPYSNMTGILKMQNVDNNLMLTSKSNNVVAGDEGIYLFTRFFTVRLPLAESFLIKQTSTTTLSANHKMWIFGIQFLEIEYIIEKSH